jgi:hypothetical protein
MLHAYTRDGKHFRGKPDVLSSRRDYYSVRKKDGTVDNTVEHVLANDVEHEGIAALRKLASGEQISVDERARLCVYMALQYLRTPNMRTAFEGIFASLLDHVLRRGMREPGRFEAAIASSQNLEPEKAEQLARKARGAYLGGRIRIEVRPELSLREMFEHCKTYAVQMHLCKWEVLTSTQTDFVTSDCPIHFRSKDHVALADPELVMHFPLSAKNMLIMRATEPEDFVWQKLWSIMPERYLPGFVVWYNHVEHRQVSPEETQSLNAITAAMCEKVLYSPFATDEFRKTLALPSQSPKIRVTASRDELHMSLDTA